MPQERHYHFREITPADEPFLRDMIYQAVYVPPGTPLPGKEILKLPKLAQYAHNWGKEGDQGLIALDADRNVRAGAVWTRLFSAPSTGYGYVADHIPELTIALLPEYRGQGLGTRLLQQFFEHLQQMGYEAVSLSVVPENPAFRLYQRFGFQDTGKGIGDSLTMLKSFK